MKTDGLPNKTREALNDAINGLSAARLWLRDHPNRNARELVPGIDRTLTELHRLIDLEVCPHGNADLCGRCVMDLLRNPVFVQRVLSEKTYEECRPSALARTLNAAVQSFDEFVIRKPLKWAKRIF